MASSTETTASTSIVGATPSRTSGTSGMPPLEPMETSPPLTTMDLLLTAGVGRGASRWTPQQAPTAPGPHQPGTRAPPPQMPTPGGQGATASTPYQWQVFPPSTPTPRQSAAPRASRSQGWERLAGKETGPWGRWSSRGPGTGNKPLDPPPEDQGSAAVWLKMMISRTRCRTMWPRDGSETSSTS